MLEQRLSGRHLVYSVAKTVLGVLCLRLDLDLEAPIATWVDDGRLPRTSLRQLLNHTSGIPDYGEPTRRLLLSGDERVDVQAQALDEL